MRWVHVGEHPPTHQDTLPHSRTHSHTRTHTHARTHARKHSAGLQDPGLGPEQQALTGVKVLSYASAAGGIVLGCLLGMVSLFFKDLGAAERLKRQKEVRGVLCAVCCVLCAVCVASLPPSLRPFATSSPRARHELGFVFTPPSPPLLPLTALDVVRRVGRGRH